MPLALPLQRIDLLTRILGIVLEDAWRDRVEQVLEAIAPSSSPNVTFHEGDVVRLRLPGGGGYGDPARRRRERIEADLKTGYVTPEGARRDYGYG